MTLSNSISNIFGVSPIKPIQNHMAEVINCVSKLEDFLNATFADDWVTAAEVFDQISVAEQTADKLKKQFQRRSVKHHHQTRQYCQSHQRYLRNYSRPPNGHS